jgi:hypothetical protein
MKSQRTIKHLFAQLLTPAEELREKVRDERHQSAITWQKIDAARKKNGG